jgi:hypothetical protein
MSPRTTTTERTTTMSTIAATHALYLICRPSLADYPVEGSYSDACQAAQDLGAAVVGHPGDLSEGGDRTLFWGDEDAAESDDGARAMGSIRLSGFDI